MKGEVRTRGREGKNPTSKNLLLHRAKGLEVYTTLNKAEAGRRLGIVFFLPSPTSTDFILFLLLPEKLWESFSPQVYPSPFPTDISDDQS